MLALFFVFQLSTTLAALVDWLLGPVHSWGERVLEEVGGRSGN